MSNVLLVFLPAIVFSAARYGVWVAAWSVALSMAGTAYFIGPPSDPFSFEYPVHLWALAAFVITAAFSSAIGLRMRQQTVAIHRQNTFANDMYTFTSRLAAASSVDDVARALILEVHAMLDRESTLFLPRDGELAPCDIGANVAASLGGHRRTARVLERRQARAAARRRARRERNHPDDGRRGTSGRFC